MYRSCEIGAWSVGVFRRQEVESRLPIGAWAEGCFACIGDLAASVFFLDVIGADGAVGIG